MIDGFHFPKKISFFLVTPLLVTFLLQQGRGNYFEVCGVGGGGKRLPGSMKVTATQN